MKKSKRNVPENRLPILWRVFIIIFILTLLIYLFYKGGNGAGWYPGRPIYMR
jgi:hypothetical protein